MGRDAIRSVVVGTDSVSLAGTLRVSDERRGLVIFAHGSGSSRHSPRNQFVASVLVRHGFATLLMDLLTESEETRDRQTAQYRFDIALLADRLREATLWAQGHPDIPDRIGYFGASTGAAAAEGGPNSLSVVEGATHLFEEPGALDEVAPWLADGFASTFPQPRRCPGSEFSPGTGIIDDSGDGASDSALSDPEWRSRMKISEVMTTEVESISPNDPCQYAAVRMGELEVGILPVTREGRCIGVVTDRDIALRCCGEGLDPRSTPASAIMTREVIQCRDGQELSDATQVMETHKLRRLVITDEEGYLRGLISVDDLATRLRDPGVFSRVLRDVSLGGPQTGLDS